MNGGGYCRSQNPTDEVIRIYLIRCCCRSAIIPVLFIRQYQGWAVLLLREIERERHEAEHEHDTFHDRLTEEAL